MFSLAFIRESLSKYDWIIDYEVETTPYGVVEITIRMQEEVYIMKLMAEDFNIEKVFKDDFLYMKVPTGTGINIKVHLIPEEELIKERYGLR